jgi:hypothetical protein
VKRDNQPGEPDRLVQLPGECVRPESPSQALADVEGRRSHGAAGMLNLPSQRRIERVGISQSKCDRRDSQAGPFAGTRDACRRVLNSREHVNTCVIQPSFSSANNFEISGTLRLNKARWTSNPNNPNRLQMELRKSPAHSCSRQDNSPYSLCRNCDRQSSRTPKDKTSNLIGKAGEDR